MGKTSLLNDQLAANVALHVVLDKPTVNKPVLIAAILGALDGAEHSSYRTWHVEKFLSTAVLPKRDLVRLHVVKATNKYRLQDKTEKVRQFRIMDSFVEYMDKIV